MPHERFFIDQPLFPGKDVELEDPQEFHHLAHVMRLKPLHTVELVNGKNVLAKGSITHLSKHTATIHIHEAFQEPLKSSCLTLVQALPRFSRLETILEKGTELGVDAFWLFPGMQSEKEDLSSNQKRRMDLILQGAMKQCGRLLLPTVTLLPPLLTWKEIPSGALFFGDLDGKPFKKSNLPNQVFLFIGPEKGWSLQEKTFLKERLSATGILLHSNTLRADTAAIVGCTLLTIN